MKPTVAVVAFTLLAAAAIAQPPPPAPPGPPGPMANRMQRLGLTPDQSKRVQDVLKQFGPRMRDLEGSLRDKRRTLERLYRDYKLDVPQARQMNAQINKVQQDILDSHLELQLELRKILTADQFSRLRMGMDRRRQQPGHPPQ